MVRLREVPRRLTVVGAGIAGLEAASVAAALGVDVTLVDRADEPADELDQEIAGALVYHLRGLGVTVRLGEEVRGVGRPAPGAAVTLLASGEEIASDAVIYAAGREGATADLGLDAAGLRAGPRGLIAGQRRPAHGRSPHPRRRRRRRRPRARRRGDGRRAAAPPSPRSAVPFRRPARPCLSASRRSRRSPRWG